MDRATLTFFGVVVTSLFNVAVSFGSANHSVEAVGLCKITFHLWVPSKSAALSFPAYSFDLLDQHVDFSRG
jgi:hypothetical protein